MAGFNLDTQHSYTIPGGGRAESGTFSFCSGAYNVEVPTRLLTIYKSEACPAVNSNGLNLYATAITTDASISSGAVTFVRQTYKIDVSQDANYTILGW